MQIRTKNSLSTVTEDGINKPRQFTEDVTCLIMYIPWEFCTEMVSHLLLWGTQWSVRITLDSRGLFVG